MSLQSETVIITGATGATGGIGIALAKTFFNHGYNVMLSGTDRSRLSALEAEFDSSQRVFSAAADISNASDRQRLIDATLHRFGSIDALVNNAGVFEPRPFLEVDEAQLDHFLEVNLKGTFFLTQAAVPHMKAAGGGAVINVGTVLVNHALAGVPATAPVASKGALHALTGQLAAEFGKDNIRFNTIAPGIIRTPIHAKNGIQDPENLAGLHLLDRIGEPQEIADTALLLAKSEFVTGTTMNVDGGHVAGHAIA